MITGSKTPLTLFPPAFIAIITPEQLEEVAGEELTVKRRRVQLKKEQKDLKIARRF